MESALPIKASAFVIVRRPGGAVLCTLEGRDGKTLGVPGGKWEPEVDGASWERLAAREYEEEVGAPLPEATRGGYLEWGSGDYQVRFLVRDVSGDVADGIPVGGSPDPDGAVREIRWVHPKAAAGENWRPHVRAALLILAMPTIRRDTSRAKAATPTDSLGEAP